MLRVNVAGGTGAGKERPKAEPRPPWRCPGCDVNQPGYATRCLTARCNARRPS